jgi:hypothetical protein
MGLFELVSEQKPQTSPPKDVLSTGKFSYTKNND